MHHSRLYGVFVDVPLAHEAAAVAFWGTALGVTPVRAGPDDPFTSLAGAVAGLAMEVQAVDDAPRYHVDVETDDVEAEVRRLLAVGATEVSRPGSYAILRAPGGHLLCVVPVQSGADFFAAHARTWD